MSIDSHGTIGLMLVFCGFLAFAVLCVFGSWSCSNAPQARAVLQGQGYTQIDITGGAGLAACGGHDNSSTGFRATGPTGVRQRGVVCCGLVFKGCTVRVLETFGPVETR